MGCEIDSAAVVMIPTQGCGSYVTTITHQGLKLKLENGKTVIVDRMDDGKVHIRSDNKDWTTKRRIDVDGGHTLKDVLHGERDGYDLIFGRSFRPRIAWQKRPVRQRRKEQMTS